MSKQDIIVTGASSGSGLTTAKAMAQGRPFNHPLRKTIENFLLGTF